MEEETISPLHTGKRTGFGEYSKVEVVFMFTVAWLMLGSLFCSLQLSTGSFPKPLTEAEEQHYLALSAAGDLEARNILIERNLRLVAHIMKKYYAQSADQEDLISIGTIGLIKGISTFDVSKGTRLATYAARYVENEILMHFRAMRKSAQDVSLSDYIETGADGAALSLMDVVAEDSDLLEQINTRQQIRQLRSAVERVLTDQEKQVIVLRYGLSGDPPMRQREVAQVTGISRSYISRIEKRALQKLRREVEGEMV
jgi:RNA polymerase sporulation-specific sigma factor